MGNMLRSKKNHRLHTECTYGCCTNGDRDKTYRSREKREADLTIKSEREEG